MAPKQYVLAQEILAHEGCVRCICVLPDGRFVTGGYDGKIAIWFPLKKLENSSGQSYSQHASVNPKSSQVAEVEQHTTDFDCEVMESENQQRELMVDVIKQQDIPPPDMKTIDYVQFCPIVSYSLQKQIYYNGKQFVYCISASKFKVDSDSHYAFFCGGKDKNAFKINADTGETISKFAGAHTNTVCSLKESDDGKKLITGSWDGCAVVWDANTTEIIAVLKNHSYAVSIDELPDGRIITGSQDKIIRFWEHYKEIRNLPDSHGDIIRKFLVYDGVFLSASNDESIKCWSINGELLGILKGHNSFVFDLSLSNKHKQFIFSASEDRTVRVWNLDTFSSWQELRHPSSVWAVVELLNGDLVTACEDGFIRVWTEDDNCSLLHEIVQEPNRIIQENDVDDKTKSSAEFENLLEISESLLHPGNHYGEVRFFLDNGVPYAYKWNGSLWTKIGELSGINRPKIYYPGDCVL